MQKMIKKKRRKLTSLVWNDFTIYKDSAGNDKKSFVGDSNSGTSHLAAHLKRCTAKIYKDRGQKTIATMKNLDGKTKDETFKFDQHRIRMDLARMIIKHNCI